MQNLPACSLRKILLSITAVFRGDYRPTDDSREIIAAAVQGLRRLWRKGYAFHKVGLMLLDLSPKANRQLTLTETLQTDEEDKRSERLMNTMDMLNRELGRGAVQIGLARSNNAWSLRSERRTPRYTTQWGELLIARTGFKKLRTP